MVQMLVGLLFSFSLAQDSSRFFQIEDIPLDEMRSEITAATQLSDGAIILGGHFDSMNGGCLLTKLGAIGKPNKCFGDPECRRGGTIRFYLPNAQSSREKYWYPNRSCFVTNIAEQTLQNGGKRLLVLGHFYGDRSHDPFLARFYPDGRRDFKFGSARFTQGSEFARTVGGYFRPFPSHDDSEIPRALKVRLDGTIVFLTIHYSSPDRFSLFKVNEDGSTSGSPILSSHELSELEISIERPGQEFVFDSDSSFLMAGAWRDETLGTTRFLFDQQGTITRDGDFGHYYKSRTPEALTNQKSEDFRGKPGLVKNDYTQWTHLEEGIALTAEGKITVLRDLGFGRYYFNSMSSDGNIHQISHPRFKIGNLDDVEGILVLYDGFLIFGHYSKGATSRMGILKLQTDYSLDPHFSHTFPVTND